MDKLGDVVNIEVIHREVSDPLEVDERIVHRSVFAPRSPEEVAGNDLCGEASNQEEPQKEALCPSPTIIFVAALKRFMSVVI